MKKLTCLVCMLFLLLTVIVVPSALALEKIDYSGNWVCMFVDLGDGVMQTDYEGQSLQEMIFFELRSDGTVLLTSFGEAQEGLWQVTGAGIALIVDDLVVPFAYQDDQLVNSEDGTTMYFTRSTVDPKQGGFSNLINIGKNETPETLNLAGTWHAITYEASGVAYDIDMFFPDGIIMTLGEDGTGSMQLTPDYTETITWSETDGSIAISGSYIMYNPVWVPETETLSLCYATDIVRINFEKTGAEPTEEPANLTSLPQAYTCEYFNAAFPETWEQDEYNTYSWDQYYSVQYNLNDKDGWSISNIRITASTEEVANYRSKIDTLLEYAKESGKDTLDELTIDGITFFGTEYKDSWSYADYAARVPEASITLSISISDPGKIEDILPDILSAIRFSFAIPDPPNADPPLPEDGVPYQPSPTTINVGGYSLKAEWLATEQSIIPKDTYSAYIAAADGMAYILSGQKLSMFNRIDGMLTAAGDTMTLNQDYSFLDIGSDGTLYISDGFYSALTLQDGVMQDFSLDGYLVMHPDGLWGLTFWSSYDVKKVTFTADGLATKPWVLTGLSDDAARQGRFSSVNYMTITDDYVFVAGSDALSDNATRIAMYDFDGNELALFGSSDWMDDSAIGSVSGIIQTGNGIIVQDGIYQDYKLFALDGTFLGNVRCDDLLGTDYPWPAAMAASDSGVLVLVSQEREDKSAVELLVFEITGF